MMIDAARRAARRQMIFIWTRGQASVRVLSCGVLRWRHGCVGLWASERAFNWFAWPEKRGREQEKQV
jgi:hypothetical protein